MGLPYLYDHCPASFFFFYLQIYSSLPGEGKQESPWEGCKFCNMFLFPPVISV